MKRTALLALLVVLAAGCGSSSKKSSNGFGAATQPLPAAETGVSTSQETPRRRKYAYPRKLARRLELACRRTGRSAAVCTCVLVTLENSIPSAKLGGSGIEARVRRLTKGCPKSG